MHTVVVLLLFATLCRYMGYCFEYRDGGEGAPLPAYHRIVFWGLFGEPLLKVSPELILTLTVESPVVNPNTCYEFLFECKFVPNVVERYVPHDSQFETQTVVCAVHKLCCRYIT